MPGASAIIVPDSPEFTVAAATDEFAAFASAAKEDLIGSSLFRFFPDNPDAPSVSGDIRGSLQHCINSKNKSELAQQRYDIAGPDGKFREMYWTVIHTPVLDQSGNLDYIIHTAVDVTDRVLAEIKNKKIKSLEPAQNLFNQTAVAIHIFKGPELTIALANEPTLKLWRKDVSVVGRPLAEVLPELTVQHYHNLIEKVMQTEEPLHAYEAPVVFERENGPETFFFNFLLQPYYETGSDEPVGVIAMANDVTQIINDRKVLKEKERSLALAVEIGDLGVFSIDLNSGTVSYSPQIMEWFGLTRLNLPLEELLCRIHPEDRKRVTDTLIGLSDGKRARKHDLMFRVVQPETDEIQYLRSIGQVQTEDGRNVTLSGIIQDMTIQVQSQIELRQSAQRLRSFIDSAPFPIGVYTGREMRIEMVNQAILDAWGRDESVLGKTYSEVLSELEGTGIYEQLDQVYTTGTAFHAHNRRIDLIADGKLESFYFNYSFTPLFDADGNVYGVMNTAADVTDLNVAQKALAESERNFRMMILQAPVAMCLMLGRDLVIDVANESMIEIWGKTREAVMNKPVFEALPDAKGQGLETILDRVFQTGEVFTAHESPVNLLRFGNLETVYQNFVYEPYKDGEGNVIGVIAITSDVTPQVLARQRIEEVVRERTKELAETNLRLQSSNAELEQFAYIASHDLQEPLRKINMFVGLLGSSLASVDERSQKYMDNIGISVNRMTNLITDILSYSQLSRKHEVFEPTDLQLVFEETISDFDLIIEENNATVKTTGLGIIEAIPLQMVQLFHNLISNALKYHKPDVAAEIVISGKEISSDAAQEMGLPHSQSNYFEIRFSDNGIGFAPEYEAKIFNIFHRLHGKSQYEGTGIGLAMCKKIAENHNGAIFARGSEGKGAEFVVLLPQKQL